jgi:hypothetical protein
MTRTHTLLSVAALLTASALVLRSRRAEPERTVEPAAVASPAVVRGTVTPPGPAGPLDGLYFPGGSRKLTLALSRRVFVLEDSAAPAQVIQGEVDAYNDTLTFRSARLDVRCRWTLEKGRLVIRDGWPDAYARPCHVLFRRADDDLRPNASAWSLDLGQAGLTPFSGTSGLGLWVDDEGHRMRMVAGPAPAPDPNMPKIPPDDLLHWNPDHAGVGFELLPFDHVNNHFDTDVNAFWVMTGPDTALHVFSGGCNELDERVSTRAFRRATGEEFEAVGAKFRFR